MKNKIANKSILAALVLCQFLVPNRVLSAPIKTGKHIVLITPEEAAKPDAKPIKGMSNTEEPSEGPLIEFEAPTPGSEVAKPVPIKISFKENSAPIDLGSLEVAYLKLFSIDITDRVKPFATISGINIENADLPAGSHKVRFSIRDTEKKVTERTLKIKILE